MKIKIKWIILIITIISILLLLLKLNNLQNLENNSINNEINDNNDSVFSFYIFDYEIPEGLKFSNYKTKRFKVEGNGWYAIVGMIYDKNKKIYDNIAEFQRITRDNSYNYNISIGDVITINDTKIITFKDEDGKGLICYFATEFGIDYEIEIFNIDGSYKSDALNELIVPLLNVTYENDGTNDFYVGFSDDGNL